MELILAVVICVLLAYGNGANDNFKGVATLLGSGTTSYRKALLWATITTALGSVTALVLARALLSAFAGEGLVPPEAVSDPRFAMAVALAAGSTVLLATRLGFPISTTHALVGGLVGAGLLASPAGINVSTLVTMFLLPLLTSPVLAFLLSIGLYPSLSYVRRRLGIEQETCVCVGDEIVGVVPGNRGPQEALAAVSLSTVAVGTTAQCHVRYRGKLLGLSAGPAFDGMHFLSAGVVSFARGLNDTPKIAALLLVGMTLPPGTAILLVGVAIAAGGLIGARRVAETMSHRVTSMNPGQGLTANIVTGLLVVGASQLGMPVSTTHVSCGALFGIGTATGGARWKMIFQILLAWVVTLPLAAMAGALAAGLMSALYS